VSLGKNIIDSLLARIREPDSLTLVHKKGSTGFCTFCNTPLFVLRRDYYQSRVVSEALFQSDYLDNRDNNRCKKCTREFYSAFNFRVLWEGFKK
jgi:uncharacterized protein with PIN domain